MPYLIFATKSASPGGETPPVPSSRHSVEPSPSAAPSDTEARPWAGEPYEEGDESNPAEAFAAFRASNDATEAWLDKAADGTLTGWVRSPDGVVYRYADPDAWAVDVDDAGMNRTGDPPDEAEAGAFSPQHLSAQRDDAPPDKELEEGNSAAEHKEEEEEEEEEAASLLRRPGTSVKHLPGEHNQETHGHRYGLRSGARILIRAGREAGRAAVRAGPAESAGPSLSVLTEAPGFSG